MNREFNCTVKTRIEKFHPHFYLMSKKYFQCTSLVVLDSPIKTHYDTECRTYYADNRLSANLPVSLSEALNQNTPFGKSIFDSSYFKNVKIEIYVTHVL